MPAANQMNEHTTLARTRRTSLLLTLALIACGVLFPGLAVATEPYGTYEHAVSTSGPASDYRFNDAVGSETIADSTGSCSGSNHGFTLEGEGPFPGSKSGELGGLGYGHLSCDPLKEADSFTFEGWVLWKGAAYSQPVFELGSGTSDYMYLTPSSTASKHPLSFEIHTSSSSTVLASTKAVPQETWTYLAVTETGGGTITLYVDGENVASATSSLSPASLGSSVGDDYLGRTEAPTERRLDGALSNLAFYTKALTASEVEAHYADAEFPVNTSPPTVSGRADEGETLSASPGSWTGLKTIKFEYAWERCHEGKCSEAAKLSKTSTYKLARADVGDEVRVVVSATNPATSITGAQTALSASSATVEGVPVNVSAPVVSGTPEVGQELLATEGSWTGFPAPSFSYQWEDCTSKECVPIHTATAHDYLVTASEVGTKLRAAVSASSTAGYGLADSAQTASVTPGPPRSVEPPSISGEAREEAKVHASTGDWLGSEPIAYEYQWERCTAPSHCTAIAGANAESYVLTAADVGDTVRVSVTATNSVGHAASDSNETAEVQPAGPRATRFPTITGLAVDGQTLTASKGEWEAPAETSYTYQWYRCSSEADECEALSGATGLTYEITQNDIGDTLEFLVTATADGQSGYAWAFTSTVSAAPLEERTRPYVAGVATAGEVLTAYPGEWVGTDLGLDYQWERCNAGGSECATIAGATGREYALASDDVGSSLRVRVGATSRAAALSDTSQATAEVRSEGSLIATKPPGVTGTPQAGQRLIATDASWSDTGVEVSYQWEACNRTGTDCAAIGGETSETFRPSSGYVGDTLRVAETATVGKEHFTEVSSTTEPVAGAGLPTVAEKPAIKGTVIEGEHVSLMTGTWAGEVLSYAYEWLTCDEAGGCEAVAGATGSTLALTSAEVGSRLVGIVKAAAHAGTTIATSSVSVPVAARELTRLTSPLIQGSFAAGQELSVDPGIVTGLGPISTGLQWESCTGEPRSCGPISEATEAEYEAPSEAAGSALRVAVRESAPDGEETRYSEEGTLASNDEETSSRALAVADESDEDLLAKASTAELSGEAVRPEIEEGEEDASSSGSLTTSSFSRETPGEFAVNTPIGELSLTPALTPVSSDATPVLVNHSAMLVPDSGPDMDTILRPEPLGADTILQLRGPEAPTSVSWEVNLGPEQHLARLDSGAVAVIARTEGEEGPQQAEPAVTDDDLVGEAPSTEVEREEESAELATSEGAEREGTLEDELPTEPPPRAPEESAAEGEPGRSQPQPQNSAAAYEAESKAVVEAEAKGGEQALLVVGAPHAVDADGNTVPSEIVGVGSTLTLSVHPSSETVYPVHVLVEVSAPTNVVSEERDPIAYGLSDQEPTTFSSFDRSEDPNRVDPNLTSSTGARKMKTARFIVPYDVFAEVSEKGIGSKGLFEAVAGYIDEERNKLKQWLEAVKTDGLTPIVTLGENYPLSAGCKANKAPCVVPSLTEYKEDFEALVKNDPGVKYWGAWNEPEVKGDPLRGHPERAARYWQIAQKVLSSSASGCTNCHVVAGEFAFAESYAANLVSRYELTVRHVKEKGKNPYKLCTSCASGRPTIWGFHDYHDVVHRSLGYATEFKSQTHKAFPSAHLWITEAGVELSNNGKPTILYHSDDLEQRAAAESFLELHKVSPHIERIYYYQYRAPSEAAQKEGEEHEEDLEFDSALFEAYPGGGTKDHAEAREAYCVIAFADKSCKPTVETAHGYHEGLVNPNGRSTRIFEETGEIEGPFGPPEEVDHTGPTLEPITIDDGPTCGHAVRLSATNSAGTSVGNVVFETCR